MVGKDWEDGFMMGIAVGSTAETSSVDPTSYSPPSDWINIDDCAVGNINLLVSDTSMATYAFNCTTSSGQYHVDWGDGTSSDVMLILLVLDKLVAGGILLLRWL